MSIFEVYCVGFETEVRVYGGPGFNGHVSNDYDRYMVYTFAIGRSLLFYWTFMEKESSDS